MPGVTMPTAPLANCEKYDLPGSIDPRQRWQMGEKTLCQGQPTPIDLWQTGDPSTMTKTKRLSRRASSKTHAKKHSPRDAPQYKE